MTVIVEEQANLEVTGNEVAMERPGVPEPLDLPYAFDTVEKLRFAIK